MPVYHSPYRAEAWDLNCTHGPDYFQDAHIYWDAYNEMRSLRKLSTGDMYTILDVGTGGGRILWEIGNRALESRFKPEETHFIGIDISEHMLERARYLTPKTLASQVSILHCSALDLKRATSTSVDLLIFGIGSISHLWEAGQCEKFLYEVAKVLRPDTGRAYISLLHDHDEDTTAAKEGSAQSSSLPLEIASEIFPNTVYRQEYGAPQIEGNVFHIQSTLTVVDKKLNGQELIMESDSATTTLRKLPEDELISMAQEAGLSLVDKVGRGAQTVYILRSCS